MYIIYILYIVILKYILNHSKNIYTLFFSKHIIVHLNDSKCILKAGDESRGGNGQIEREKKRHSLSAALLLHHTKTSFILFLKESQRQTENINADFYS